MKAFDGDSIGNEHPDSLDRLLQSASWPTPRAEQLERLDFFWRHTRRRQVIGRMTAIGMAAAILASVAAVRWWARPTRASDVSLRPDAGPAMPVATKSSPTLVTPDLAPEPITTAASVPAVRAPNRYESAMLLAFRAQPPGPARRPRPVEPAPSEFTLAPVGQRPFDVRAAVQRLCDDPALAVDAILPPALDNRDAVETELLELIDGRLAQQRQSAIRLLCPIASSRSWPTLVACFDDRATRFVAAPGVARLADLQSLVRFIDAEVDESVQRQLLGGLLQRGTKWSTTAFLQRVNDPDTSEAALNAVATAGEVPIDRLFALLEAPHHSLRTAAAQVLGRHDGPVVTARLADMVLRNVGRREALLALLSNRGQEAVGFVTRAERDPKLASHVRAARVQLADLLQRSPVGA